MRSDPSFFPSRAAPDRRRWSWATLATVLALLTLPVSAAAQQPVGGTVVDAATQRPIAGAQVAVQGTQLGTLTDNRGRFLILNVPGQEVTLEVVMIGYRAFSQATQTGQVDLTLALTEAAISLDEIVVTGTAGGQQTRAIGNAVGKVTAEALEEIAPAMSIQNMLGSQVTGVRVMSSGGEIGAGGVMRIRGASSISLAATPLVYVDGVRVNGEDNTSLFGGIGFDSGGQPSRINDFNPDDIESIEIIKGPAAATLYGTEATNGVIQIITKRGNRGAPRVNVTMKQGANWMPDPEQTFPSTYYTCTGVSQTAPVPAGADPAAFDRYRCNAGEIKEFNVLAYDREVFGNEWFTTGHAQSYGADVSGGSDQVTYYFSSDWDRDEGFLPYNWRNHLSGRANISYTPSDRYRFDFSLAQNRIRAQAASAQQPLSTAVIWACPDPGCEAGSGFGSDIAGPYRGYIAYLPEAYANEIEGFQDVDRTTFSIQGRHDPFDWLTHSLTVGGDFSNIRNSELYKATGNIGQFQAHGRKWIINLRSTFVSVDYGANADYELSDDFSFTTSGGVQFYRRQEESTQSVGEFFPIEALTTVSSGSVRRGEEDFLENRTFGVFVQEQLNWRDRVYITGAIRGDDNSAFGKNFDFVVYPKFSMSWVLSDEDFLADASWLSTLKFRGAWGKAGKQPDVFDALRTYEPVVGANSEGVLTPENIGNPDLKPEVGQELELGFDAGLLDDRVGVEFTYYNQKTKDAIIRVPALPSLGFPGVQFRNLGEVSNTGLEMGVDVAAYRSENLGLDFRFTLSRNNNEILSLGGEPFIDHNSRFGQYHVAGFPLASVFRKRVVSADLVNVDGRNEPTNVMCESGPLVPGGNFSEGGGPPVPCADAPEVYWGQPLPVWEGGVGANVSLYRNLQIYALVDFIGGRTFENGDVMHAHLTFRQTRAMQERTDPILLGYQSLGTAGRRQAGIIDGDFAKLRTISANYTLPQTFADAVRASRVTLTVTGQNLLTLWTAAPDEWYGHKLMDPERTNQAGGATPGLEVFLQESWPQAKRVITTFRFSF